MDLLMRRHQQITAAAAFDFAYIIYILTASCIAAAGLVMDNSEVIVASMLISPIMNHVTAAAFGILLRDRALMLRGMLGMTLGALIGAAMGALAGLYFGPTMVLTNEMLARTQVVTLKWSLLVAFFSALAAGVSILHEQTANLVGIAISTSVLPPIVNAGLLLPNALLDRPNAVPVRACVLSAGIAWGNVLVIAITSTLIILAYVRLPANEAWRPRSALPLP